MRRFYVLSEAQCSLIEELLPPLRGKPGRKFFDARTMVEDIMYRHCTGSAWRDFPEVYGHWRKVWT